MAIKKSGKQRVQITVQEFVEVEDPTARLPQKAVQVLQDEGIRVQVDKLSNRLLADQGRAMAGGNGCISNPGGPSC